MNTICYDSSKFVNAEIEFSGADNETRIVVTRIHGSESDRRFDLKVGNWSLYGRYFQANLCNSVSQLVECSTGDQTRVACSRLTAWSHCVVSFQKQDILSAAALVLV